MPCSWRRLRTVAGLGLLSPQPLTPSPLTSSMCQWSPLRDPEELAGYSNSTAQVPSSASVSTTQSTSYATSFFFFFLPEASSSRETDTPSKPAVVSLSPYSSAPLVLPQPLVAIAVTHMTAASSTLMDLIVASRPGS